MTNMPPINRATVNARSAQKQGTHVAIDLTAPESWPYILQPRANFEIATVPREGSKLTREFPVDRRHLEAMKESFRAETSPVHLKKDKRPLLVELTGDLETDADTIPNGTTVLVEGIHRFAAAFALGRWSQIYCNKIEGSPDEVALLQAAANKDPVLPARSKEDIAKSLVQMTRNGEPWPSIKDGVGIFKVAPRTYKRARRLAREQLGLQDSDMPDRPDSPDWIKYRLEKRHVRQFRATLKDISKQAPEADMGVLLHRFASELLRINDLCSSHLDEALRAALEGEEFPPNVDDDHDENPDF